MRTSVIEAEEADTNRLDNNECCICLAEPKIFRVAVTCGHSYCADCIFRIYAKHSYAQIECPYCRAKIITIFKAFPEAEPRDRIEEIRMQIREYNSKFGDDRSIKRTIIELPFVLTRIVDHVFSFKFVLYFLKNFAFLKIALALILYFMLPVDIVPAAALGLVGYLDDLAIAAAVALYTLFAVGKASLDFLRLSQ